MMRLLCFAFIITSALSAPSLSEDLRCSRSQDGNVRLVGFNSMLAGYVQICSESSWRKILLHDRQWTKKNSIVVCRQLGYLDALKVTNKESIPPPAHDESYDTTSVDPLSYASVQCTGLEERLTDCANTTQQLQSDHPHEALVICKEAPQQGELRVVGTGPDDNEGILEIYHPHSLYRWSTLCANKWDDSDASVACKQLGFMSGKSKIKEYSVGARSLLPWRRYDNFDCKGTESYLTECSFDGPYPYKCYSGDTYAGVVCQDYDTETDSIKDVLQSNISLLLLISGVSLLLLTLVCILLGCTIRRFKNKGVGMSSSSELDVSGNTSNSTLSQSPTTVNTTVAQRGVTRVQLSSEYWQENTQLVNMDRGAPPSYQETIFADHAHHQQHTANDNSSTTQSDNSENNSTSDCDTTELLEGEQPR